MKKLLFGITMITLAAASASAQGDGDKKVKMGIAITPAVNWLAPDNTHIMSGNGAVMKMGIGLTANFRLTDVIWLHTGLEYTGAGGKLDYSKGDTAVYGFQSGSIIQVAPNTTPPSGTVGYRLLQRTYKTGYIHIPIGFKLKTKEIGMFTYYGQIGGDLFLKTSSKGDDNVSNFVTSSSLVGNNLNSVVNFFNAAVHFGGGAEYRFSGSTTAFASLVYQHGIANYTNSGTNYLLKESVGSNGHGGYTVNESQYANGAKLRQVVLTIGILF